CMQNLQIPFTF
nr:immunoglobulin light chain junction region [Macaca mulatta]MOW10745.1 immunoglobulin light chain junction region [Macaca mulatta]